MGKKITIILQNGKQLTWKNARVVEGKKTWIYQVTKTKRPEKLLAMLDPNHIKTLCIEEDRFLLSSRKNPNPFSIKGSSSSILQEVWLSPGSPRKKLGHEKYEAGKHKGCGSDVR